MKSRKRGFTVVEIVIALAIIAIISLAATSLVLISQSSQKKSRDKFFAVTLCNNTISVVQSAAKDSKSLDEMYELFTDRIDSLLSIKLDNLTDSKTKICFDGSWKQLTSDFDDTKFECVLSFTNGQDDGIEKTVNFNMQVRNVSKDTEIYSTSYLVALGG